MDIWFFSIFLFTSGIARVTTMTSIFYRIISGDKSIPGEFPFMISIQVKNVGHICGGTILNKRWSLSAAHCCYDITDNFYPISSLMITVGSIRTNAGYTHDIKTIHIHKMFNLNHLFNDIALIQVEKPYVFGKFVKPIAINPLIINDDQTLEATVIGWGFTSDDDLKNDLLPLQQYHVNVETVPTKMCMKLYKDATVNNLCVSDQKGKGTCVGDSGGPLVYKGQQIGVLSFGEKKCTAQKLEVYTKISNYYNWITSIMSNGRAEIDNIKWKIPWRASRQG